MEAKLLSLPPRSRDVLKLIAKGPGTYRDLLFRVAGGIGPQEISPSAFSTLLAEFVRLGWVEKEEGKDLYRLVPPIGKALQKVSAEPVQHG